MRVLIVDDVEINQKLLGVILASSGHESVEATDGVEALQTLRSGGFDAVISDVLMPKMDGYRLCYEIRRSPELREIPVIIYTSTYTSPADEKLALRVGADRFIRRPAPAGVILTALKEVGSAARSSPQAVPPTLELEILKEYNEGLVRKLERKNVDVEASEKRYRALVDLAPIGIFRSTRDGRFVSVNAALVRLLGYDTEEELLRLDLRKDLYFDDAERERMARQVEENREIGSFETRMKREDGGAQWVRLDVRGVPGESGRIEYFEGFVHDIQARKSAEESVQKLLSAVEQAENVILMTDLNGAITYVNPAFEKTYGYSKQEALGKTPRLLKGVGHDRAFYQRFWRELLAGESVRLEFVNKRRDGRFVTVENCVSPVLDLQGRRIGFLAVQNDITERKLAQESLQASEKRFRNYFELGLLGMAITSPTKSILEVNDELCRILGYEREELLKTTWPELTHPEDLPADVASFDRVLAGEIEGYTLEKRWIRKDGRTIHSIISVKCVRHADGSVDQFAALIQDITDRKLAEAALKASEVWFRSLIENSKDLILVLDATATIRYASPSVEVIIGVPAATVTGSNSLRYVHPDDVPRLTARLTEILTSETATVPISFRVRHSDGSWRTLEAIGTNRVGDPAIGGVILNARDATETRRTETALKESEERYRLLFENNPQAMWVFDEETLAFLAVNDAACRRYGYSREEFLGMTIRDIRPANDIPDLLTRVAAETRDYQDSGVWRHRKKDGEVIEVEISSYPMLFDGRSAQLVLSIDVTERRRAEKEMRRSEERFRRLFDANTIGIAIADLSGGILETNDAYLNMLGYTRVEHLAGKFRWDDLTPPEHRGRDQVAVEQLQRTGVAQPWEKELIRKDGARVPILIGVAMLGESEGRCIAYIVDLSARRQLEEQFRQAQKMEAIGQLAGGVAHDFNNLLTAILGYSDLLSAEVGEGSPLLESIDEIRKAGERAAGLTRQLLAFSRRQVLEPKVLDVNALIGNLEKMLRRLIGEDIVLATALAPSVGAIRADAGQIEQILLNLAVNARDAMPRGGLLTIETANVELDAAYAREHIPVQPGAYVMIAVTDTGTGMTPETKSHIFEPFFTTKEKGKGTGLGLATLYGIVKQSAGYVWVYSEPGHGATFKVYLPRVEARIEAVSDRPPTVAPARATETVLLVEDDEAVRALTRRILESRGHFVLEASDAQQALETARSHEGPIHLLLTDVVMPKMGGSDLASRLNVIRPETRVVYMSGYTDDAVVRQGLIAEGVLFLQKPFTPEGLARKVREALA